MGQRRLGIVTLVAGALVGVLGSGHPASAAIVTVDFDAIAATCCYAHVVPGGPRGPVLVFPDVTFDSGVVMSEDGWSGGATTAPNLYGTSDFIPLADSSLLPGFITGTFTGTVDSITLDIINGFGASVFTLSAYDVGDVLLDSDAIALAAFTTPGFVGSASVSGSGIKKFKVTSSQATRSIDFAIDTVVFDIENGAAIIPEPTSLLLFGLGGLGAGWMRRRRLRC